MPAKGKLRLDLLLLQAGLAGDQKEAQALILAGQVLVNGELKDKPGMSFRASDIIELRQSSQYVGRGALKLKAAFESFPISVQDKVCADVGASTGGFTQVLLERGAKKVYSVDVAYGELHWKLRQDPRVVVMERMSVSTIEVLPEPIQFASIDVSLLSLKVILPAVQRWLVSNQDIVALVKPQYEASREQLPVGAVIKDASLHEAILTDLRLWCETRSIKLNSVIPSPILGMGGNQEFLAWITMGPALR